MFLFESLDPLKAYFFLKKCKHCFMILRLLAQFTDKIGTDKILQGIHSFINMIKFQYKDFFHLKEVYTVFLYAPSDYIFNKPLIYICTGKFRKIPAICWLIDRCSHWHMNQQEYQNSGKLSFRFKQLDYQWNSNIIV